MTRGRGPSAARTTERGIRFAIIGVFLVGVRRRNPSAVVNAGVALATSLLPDVLESQFAVEFRPWQRVYAVAAMFTHAVGMLGPYEDVRWWDHLTHVQTATLLGGLVHVTARRRGRRPRVYVVAAVGCGGVLWELLEYTTHAIATRFGLEPLLIPYGERDTLFDLLFNLLGAALVIVFGDPLLRNFTGEDD